MPSIELLLDDTAEQELRGEWATLADAGLPSQARHTGESNRPHVTLIYSETPLEPPPISGLPLEIAVASPVVLGSARRGFVLARMVRATHELLAVHADLHARVAREARIDALTLPGSWTPHVTLARRLTPPLLAEALGLLDVRRAIPATVSEARLWESTTRTVTPLRTL
ncbi:MAG: hypothetical protein JWR33_1493 [Naasia sp.]|uniref:2'-5' RNA ligase family protein n=1 Tax=Naasia sp. TaxID=2546198 RepID=UPI00261F549F|nr:2'-5' RNA ligase family protein [Naasia sp.]MCU1570752.1 hypothetical protein [Naasia sp.]